MKRALLSFLAVGAMVTGCGADATAVRFHWSLEYAGGARQQRLTCADVDGQDVGFELQDPKNSVFEPTFPCEAGQAVMETASVGTFGVFGVLTNSEETTSWLSKEVTLFGGDVGVVETRPGQTVDFNVVFPVSYFTLGWRITRGGTPMSCEDAGAKTVIISTFREFEPRRSFDIPCEGTGGATGPAPASYYKWVEYHLLDADGNPLATHTVRDSFGMRDGFRLEDGRVGNLGTADFQLK